MIEFEILLNRPWAYEWFLLVMLGGLTIVGICIREIAREIKKGRCEK